MTQKTILKHICEARGRIIHHAIEVEYLISMYIAQHFTKDEVKAEELIAMILLPRMTFENKLQIFEQLILKYNHEFKTAFPSFRNDINEIIEERNIFAHYPTDFSKEAIEEFEKEGIITLVKLKSSKSYGLGEARKMKDSYVNNLTQLM
ncbi:MAG: hypothetical protein M3342_06415, partial [Bacteroidota bacterium]|nr:hypothetical protein [Bacteroidota bacterium]